MDRRLFLKNCALLSVLSACTKKYSLKSSSKAYPAFATGIIFTPMRLSLAKRPSGQKFGFVLLSTEGKAEFVDDVPVFAHSVCQSPIASQTFLLIPKLYHQMCVYDLKTKTHRSISATQGFNFYGHGLFLNAGAEFCTSESSDDKVGLLVVRSSRDYTITKTVKLPNYNPHEMVLLNQGKVLAVAMCGKIIDDTYDGKMSEILYYDTETWTLMRRVPVDIEGHVVGHLEITRDRLFAPLSAMPSHKTNTGLIAVGKTFEKVDPLPLPDGFEGRFEREIFSILHDEERQQLIGANTSGNCVLIWDLEKQQYKKILEIPTPHGVCFNRAKTRYMITGGNGFIYFIDPTNFEVSSTFSGVAGTFSSHLSKIY